MLISRSNYERIYRVINSILLNEKADPSVCCAFFSAYGAYILERYFKVTATPYCGLAAYHLGGDLALIFGRQDGDAVITDEDGFHCWVEAEGWAIDFMAPAFSRIRPTERVPSKMFQKPLFEMAASLESLAKPGDFFLQATQEGAEIQHRILSRSRAFGDLAEIAADWFKRDPRKMADSISIGNQKGALSRVFLTGELLTGTW